MESIIGHKIDYNGVYGDLVPRAFPLKIGPGAHPFFKGKALGTRLVYGVGVSTGKRHIPSKNVQATWFNQVL